MQIADARRAAQCADRPLHLLHRAEQVASRVFHDGALGFVTPRQLAVLITVAENEGGNLTGVIQRIGMDRSTTSELVGRMTRMGLPQKRRSRRDTRAFVLKLTDEGRQLLKDAEPVSRNIDAALLRALPPARRDPFLEALRAAGDREQVGRLMGLGPPFWQFWQWGVPGVFGLVSPHWHAPSRSAEMPMSRLQAGSGPGPGGARMKKSVSTENFRNF